MWSSSNSWVVAYCTIIALLIGGLVVTPADKLTELIHIQAASHGLAMVAVIVCLGALANIFGAELLPIMITGTLGTFVALTYNQDPLTRYLTLAALLFSVGVYGMTVSRNAVRVLMSIELMLNAVNINLVAFARYIDPTAVKGQLFSIFILTVAAAEAAVGLAVVLAIYRNKATVDMEKFSLLKW